MEMCYEDVSDRISTWPEWDENVCEAEYYPEDMMNQGRSCVFYEYQELLDEINWKLSFSGGEKSYDELYASCLESINSLQASQITNFCQVVYDGHGSYLVAAEMDGKWYVMTVGLVTPTLDGYFGQ